jgi:L-ascorbate metabolism protein UlaG (beta-lactamase superfamily)
MEFSYHGANCIKINVKKATIVVDDNLAALGQKDVARADDITLATSDHIGAKTGRMHIDSPGEYEVSDISIQGVGAQGAMDEARTKNATIYKITAEDLSVVILGHVFTDITDDEVEELGHVDVLFVPVGGNGYTLDGVDALKLIKKIEPRIVIPTHYADKDLNYEVPQASLEEAVTALAMEPGETTSKLKLKAADIPETLQLYILERS